MSRMFVAALLAILISLSLGCCSMTAPPGSGSGMQASEDGNEMTLNDTRDGGDATNESEVVPGGSIGIKK